MSRNPIMTPGSPVANARFLMPDPAAVFGPGILTGVSRIGPEPPTIDAAERAHVAEACPGRRAEFAAGRRLTRELLGRLGRPDIPVPANPDGSPAWPRGVVGSISHAEDVCIVAVAHVGRLVGLGVDLEPNRPVESELCHVICTERERASLSRWPERLQRVGVRLIHSAKESVFKCLHSISKEPLEYQGPTVELDPLRGTFCVELPVADIGIAGPGFELRGRFRVDPVWIVTGVTMCRQGATSLHGW